MVETLRNLVELGERSFQRFAERPLFGEKRAGAWQWLTYANVKEQVDALRGGLASLGIKPGDRVAIISDNRVEWAVAAYATYGLEATFVPMYEAQAEEEWEFILADCEAKIVLGANDGIVSKLDTMRTRLPALERVVAIEGPLDDIRSYRALVEQGRASPVPSRHPDSDAIAAFVYTSGTTGRPKGVMLSHGNFTSNIASVTSVFPVESDDVLLSFLPWAHVYGQVVDLHIPLGSGASIAINDAIPHLLRNLEEVRPTVLVAVPRIFTRIYEAVNQQVAEKPAPIRSLFEASVRNAKKRHRGERLGPGGKAGLAIADRLIFSKIRERFGGRLKYVISGSASLSPEVAQFIDAMGIEVYEGYGLTETSPIASANYPSARKLGSVGKPIPGVTVTIDESASTEPGEGEVVVHGPNVMKGYHHRPEENAKVLLPDGSFRTGDLGRFDEDGYLYITGRIKEQYKLQNGKWVMPAPIEDALKLSPFIANVMVHGANEPYNVALVVPNFEALRHWADEQGKSIEDPTRDPDVRALVQKELDRHSIHVRSYERPRRFTLAREDFTTENGMLTPTMKIKRATVLAKYGDELRALYTERARASREARPE